MSIFLWVMLILGVFEAGGSVGYLLTGVWPARTKSGIVINLILWLGFAAWAGILLSKGQP